MYDVVILSDFEEGHLFPTFHLAGILTNAGYKIAYVGICDHRVHVRNQCFDFFSVYEDIYPQGRIVEMKRQPGVDLYQNPKHLLKITDGELDDLLATLDPQLLLISSFLTLEALVLKYKYRKPQIIFTPHLQPIGKSANVREKCLRQILKLEGSTAAQLLDFCVRQKIAVKSLSDLVAPLDEMTEIVLCPQEFDIGQALPRPRTVFLGPCVRKPVFHDVQVKNQYLPQTNAKKIIYVSLGSQVYLYLEQARKVINLIIRCISQPELSDYGLIVSLGGFFEEKEFGITPPSVKLLRWVPQIEVLKHVTLAICHGGLGSIKELITQAIPMLIIPFGRDQLDNAQRVKHHGVGLTINLEDVTLESLLQMIAQLESDQTIRCALREKQRIFLERDSSSEFLDLVRKQLHEANSEERIRTL
jgi:zeaxanthin glucosyltransferase